jgi:hypothetical protein
MGAPPVSLWESVPAPSQATIGTSPNRQLSGNMPVTMQNVSVFEVLART